MRKLNIGCGYRLLEGWVNIDIVPGEGILQRDILRGLPFDDDSVDEILCDNVLEHVRPGEDLIFVINELWRVCKNKAKVVVIVPHHLSPASCQDPTHVSNWTQRSAIYWTQKTPWPRLYGSCADFEVVGIQTHGDFKSEMFITFEFEARKTCSQTSSTESTT